MVWGEASREVGLWGELAWGRRLLKKERSWGGGAGVAGTPPKKDRSCEDDSDADALTALFSGPLLVGALEKNGGRKLAERRCGCWRIAVRESCLFHDRPLREGWGDLLSEVELGSPARLALSLLNMLLSRP